MEREGIRQSHFAPPITTVLPTKPWMQGKGKMFQPNSALVGHFGPVSLFEVV
jgi:hypothetical protein